MVQIYDEFDSSIGGKYFSSYAKNLGNKLFIYAASRVMADLLNCDLMSPENAIIRRQLASNNQYDEQVFPFGSLIRGNKIDKKIVDIDDHILVHQYGSIKDALDKNPDSGFVIKSYFSKYDYIKPYKNMVKSYFKSITLPKRTAGDVVIMLRDSFLDRSFKLSNEYYLNIIDNIEFNNLYLSFDHATQHEYLLNKLLKYNPIIIDGGILEVFKQITSFDTIIACQGTFSFWASFLSNANVIYWPITKEGPNSGINSNSEVIRNYVNLLVDDESRYKHIYVA